MQTNPGALHSAGRWKNWVRHAASPGISKDTAGELTPEMKSAPSSTNELLGRPYVEAHGITEAAQTSSVALLLRSIRLPAIVFICEHAEGRSCFDSFRRLVPPVGPNGHSIPEIQLWVFPWLGTPFWGVRGGPKENRNPTLGF